VSWPEGDISVDRELVQALLSEQHPDLAGLPLAHLDAGWDNVSWRLGPDLVVRLPRRSLAVPLIESEQRWLPELAPRLPLPVPAPVRVGRPSAAYPWPWSVVPWLEGEPGDRAPLTDPADAGRRLAAFLDALHQDAPAGAPHNPWRAVPLAVRTDAFVARVEELAGQVDAARLRGIWDAALSAPAYPGPPRWVHGDLHPANFLVSGGTIAAVIDFGDLSAGDPATDLAGAWMLLPDGAREEFWSGYPRRDDGLVARSVGWALLFGLMHLAIGLGGRPTYERAARLTLDRVLGAGLA
jgi:aminoglycoside phosphotransferase (APT) family kinase protein